MQAHYDILVIGGGHAGAEAAWAAANLLAPDGGRVALITMDPTRIGAMSCNPAIGGLAKGQMVREIDALGGLMGLASDATGIQFRILNASKGPAVHGPRCQSDKYAYAAEVQRLLATRENLDVLPGLVEDFLVEDGRCVGAVWKGAERQRGQGAEGGASGDCCGDFGPCESDPPRSTADTQPLGPSTPQPLRAAAVVLTTGTFMRALMHAGEQQTEGGRIGEGSAVGISGALSRLGFELGRLKTGTPPRLAAESIDFKQLELQPGDEQPVPFSDLTGVGGVTSWGGGGGDPRALGAYEKIATTFPVLPQRPCWITHTDHEAHELIRANLHRAPMYNGQIETAGPRYCPSIEDKVVRFADRTSHHVFLEPESLETNEIYCNGISTSLPPEIQLQIVHRLPGCENAVMLKPGYAVEYDMVWPHQIDATCMTKRLPGLFLAGQINGTSGYEEAAGQGLIAGVNAARWVRHIASCEGRTSTAFDGFRLRRDQAYLGVMMDDLVTKTPREPYRMFTSRAEHRLLLRSDNAAERLTPLGRELGTVDDHRWAVFQQRRGQAAAIDAFIESHDVDGQPMSKWLHTPGLTTADVADQLQRLGFSVASDDTPQPTFTKSGSEVHATQAQGSSSAATGLMKRGLSNARPGEAPSPLPRVLPGVLTGVLARRQYAGYIARTAKELDRLTAQDQQPLPGDLDFRGIPGLRNEAAATLDKFRPATLGQAGRLSGVNPADLMVLSVALRKA